MENSDLTLYTAIENPDGSIRLSDLMRSDGSLYGEPALHFKEVSYWDNSEYVYNFLRGLKNNKKEQNKELKAFCLENKIDYSTTKEQLIDIYKQSKRLKWWKK